MCITATVKWLFHRSKLIYLLKIMVLLAITAVILILLVHSSKVIYLNAQKMRNQKSKFVQKVINSTSKSKFKNYTRSQTMYPHRKMKFILLWTNPSATPLVYFGKGQRVFKRKLCRFTNCYVTGDRNYLGNYAFFDAVLFNGPQLPDITTMEDIPRIRSPRQKYIYVNIESEANYPLCNKAWDGFFNWTWTYRLDSDATWSYIVVKNASNHVIGPKTNMQWISVDNMDDIGQKLKAKLKTKQRAAAWFASNCNTHSRREEYVEKIRTELQKFNLDVDIYGSCGGHHCPKTMNDRCLRLLEREYYFYFAFENSLSVDYVTEKILYPLKHNTVPVVFGGANYTRFMPEGAYLDAYKLGPEKLAKEISTLMKNPQLYYKYFRWKKYYSFHFKYETPETDDYCKFCGILNDNRIMKQTSIYDDLDLWWNVNKTCYVHQLTNFYDSDSYFYHK